MPRIAWPIQLDPDTEKELRRLVRAPSTPQALVLRARIILAAAQGLSNQEIAAAVEVTANTVTKWRQRFRMFGLAGLTNWGHGGRRGKYGTKVRERLQRLVRRTPPRGGARWTLAQLSGELNIPRSSLHEILKKGGFYSRRQPARRRRR